jgi:hypothetical protein
MTLKDISFLFLIFFFLFFFLLNLLLPLDHYLDYEVYNKCFISGGYENIESGFTLICKFTKFFPENLAILFPRFLVFAFFIITTFYFYRVFGIYTATFQVFLNGFQTLGGYRQAIATLFLCIAIVFLIKNKAVKSFFYSFIAFFFHSSSFYFFILLTTKKFFNNKLFFLFLILILILYYFFKLDFLFFVDEAIRSRYINLLGNKLPDSTYFLFGSLWYLSFYTYFFLIILNKYKYITHLKLNSICNFYLIIILLVIFLTLTGSWAAVRISTMVNPFTLVFFGLIANQIQRLIIFLFFSIRFIIAFINFFIT